MKNRLKILVLLAAVLFPCALANAHVGSADVYYEGNAGPYPLYVTVRMPQVIPGVAQLQVRSSSPDVRSIKVVLLRLTGPGSKHPSTPDVAERSKQDPQFFVSDLWFLEYGALQARIEVDGAKGKAELSVPIASFPRQPKPMAGWLRALGLFVLIGLTLMVVPTIGGIAREGTVAIGDAPQRFNRRNAWIAMALTLFATGGTIYAGRNMWNEEDAVYARNVNFLKPPRVEASLQDGNRLNLKLAKPLMLPLAGKGRTAVEVKLDEVIADHGYLMHVFLVGKSGMDKVSHLHFDRAEGGAFSKQLPAMPAGEYQIFADVVDKNGYPWTLLGEVKLPPIAGTAPVGDDSQWQGPRLAPSSGAMVAQLPGGGRMVWERANGPLQANVGTSFKFRVEEADGSPARDLEPYMGMAAHMVVLRSDLNVFAHVHTNGSVPMAALDLAQAGLLAQSAAGASDAGPAMAHHHHASLPANFSIPYGVPSPGDYRFFIQIKRSGRVQTAAFDARVQ